MDFQQARPEYYQGLTVFQQHTNQQEQLKKLLSKLFGHLRSCSQELLLSKTAAENDKNAIAEFINDPLSWNDVGSGDGTFTRKMFEALQETSYPQPVYQGIEPDQYFCKVSKDELSDFPNVTITQAMALDGNLHEFGESQVISGMNVLYFANDLPLFKQSLDQSLQTNGLGLFIQNTFFTEKAGKVFIGDEFNNFTAGIETEVFFPIIPQKGFDLITGKASVIDITNDSNLTSEEKENTIITKKIIDSMGGISTETDAGQEVAKRYENRISGEEFGGKGRYVSDNLLLVYTHPNASVQWKQVVLEALKNVRNDVCGEKSTQPNHSLRMKIS